MKCCFCIKRKLGCYLIALYLLVGSLNEILTCSIDLKNGKGKHCFLATLQPQGKEITSSVKILYVTVISLCIPMIIAAIVFIIGLVLGSRMLVLVFLLCFIVYEIISIVLVIMATGIASGESDDKVFFYVYTIGSALLGIYMTVIVADEYFNMKS